MPERVQLSRAKGWKMPPNTVKVDRATRWGNPNLVSHHGQEGAVRRFEAELRAGILRFSVDDVRRDLRGKNLACWCKPGEPCHADVLLEIANAPPMRPEAKAQAKEAAHRQGPWHVSEYTDGRDALVYDEYGFEVARVCYPNRDADAKLIAAAPGLLAAARAALHYMRLHKYADQAWANDLEAAIAAAVTPNTEVTGRR